MNTTGDRLVSVRAIIVDPAQNAPVVVLETRDQQTLLPIWIGLAEASAIALALDGSFPPRPMTHDLLVNVAHASHLDIIGIRIRSVDQGVFYGELHLAGEHGDRIVLDCRPSDAIAVAARVNCSMTVAQAVLDAVGVAAMSEEQALQQVLDRLRPEDLGHYEM